MSVDTREAREKIISLRHRNRELPRARRFLTPARIPLSVDNTFSSPKLDTAFPWHYRLVNYDIGIASGNSSSDRALTKGAGCDYSFNRIGSDRNLDRSI
jgi:hypothetical protein